MSATKISIKEIIDSLEINKLDPDNFLSNTPRFYIKKIATKGISEFIEKETAKIGALILTVNNSNQVTLPADFVKTVRLSKLIKESGRLIPIAVDGSISIAMNYLLDNLGRILLDSDDVELVGSPSDVEYINDSYSFDYSCCGGYLDQNFYYGGFSSYSSYCTYYNLNDSFIKTTKYREDYSNNVIQFSGEQIEFVVLEYVTSPMKNVGDPDNLEIDTFFGDALEKYIIYEILAPRRSVSISEKEIARRNYRESLLKAKINRLTPDLNMLTSTTNLD